ncbi:MAG: hypothetical protein ACXAC7_05860 [Candidatus Hodarchaeales archaeon]|jgi:hypothetical protein
MSELVITLQRRHGLGVFTHEYGDHQGNDTYNVLIKGHNLLRIINFDKNGQIMLNKSEKFI